ncbi:hypothetical protein ACFCYB_05875 [Streptomyces sp. NPDC056309]|uniref:hypothetical protein n=1 Tax=unclassified Streptomyces TaxID=2593676 RepID=UPI0035DC5E39
MDDGHSMGPGTAWPELLFALPEGRLLEISKALNDDERRGAGAAGAGTRRRPAAV